MICPSSMEQTNTHTPPHTRRHTHCINTCPRFLLAEARYEPCDVMSVLLCTRVCECVSVSEVLVGSESPLANRWADVLVCILGFLGCLFCLKDFVVH